MKISRLVLDAVVFVTRGCDQDSPTQEQASYLLTSVIPWPAGDLLIQNSWREQLT